jgi:hypothetical protein
MSRPPAKLGPTSSARQSDTAFLRRFRSGSSACFSVAVRSNRRRQSARPPRVRGRVSRTGPSSARSAARRWSSLVTAARARTRGPPARAAKRARGAHFRRTQAGGASKLAPKLRRPERLCELRSRRGLRRNWPGIRDGGRGGGSRGSRSRGVQSAAGWSGRRKRCGQRPGDRRSAGGGWRIDIGRSCIARGTSHRDRSERRTSPQQPRAHVRGGARAEDDDGHEEPVERELELAWENQRESGSAGAGGDQHHL